MECEARCKEIMIQNPLVLLPIPYYLNPSDNIALLYNTNTGNKSYQTANDSPTV